MSRRRRPPSRPATARCSATRRARPAARRAPSSPTRTSSPPRAAGSTRWARPPTTSGSPASRCSTSAGSTGCCRSSRSARRPSSRPRPASTRHNAVRLMEEHAVTMCIFVPTQWDQVTAIPQRTRLRTAMWGAAPASRQTLEALAAHLPRRRHRQRLRPDRDVRRDHAAQGSRLDPQDGLGRPADARRRAATRRRRRRRRRDRLPRPARDARLLEQPERPRGVRRRLVPQRRPRSSRRRGLPLRSWTARRT